MEREFAEFASEIEQSGVSEKEEDAALENPSVSVAQQVKKSQKSSGYQVAQKSAGIYLKATKTVWNAASSQLKKKKDIFIK